MHKIGRTDARSKARTLIHQTVIVTTRSRLLQAGSTKTENWRTVVKFQQQNLTIFQLHVGGFLQMKYTEPKKKLPLCLSGVAVLLKKKKKKNCGGVLSCLVWAGVAHGFCTNLVVIEGNLDAQRYRDEILARHVIPLFENDANITVFQHGNATSHTARGTEFLQCE